MNRFEALQTFLGRRYKVVKHSRGKVWTVQHYGAGAVIEQRVEVTWAPGTIPAVKDVTTQRVVFANPIVGTIDLGMLGVSPMLGPEEKLIGVASNLEDARQLQKKARRDPDNRNWDVRISTDFGRHPAPFPTN